MESGKVTAVILAAGQGKRMGGDVPKQYRLLGGKPLLYYGLKTFEGSRVDELILVTGAEEMAYCRTELVERFGFGKVKAIVEGGRERYHSVYEGLKAAKGSSYVLIHDGARPFVTGDVISRAIDGARTYGACVVGMPSKDTVKVVDSCGYARETLDRSTVWTIQTPQAFAYPLVKNAYDLLMEDEGNQQGVTDDAMVVERFTSHRVKMIEGSYENIKVTTPEDLVIGEAFLGRNRQ